MWRPRFRQRIQVKTDSEVALMRAAGLVVAGALAAVQAQVQPGVTTKDLDDVAEGFIRGRGAIPSFLGYQGFPASICASVNDEVVHGIPSPRKQLTEGDIVSIDCGAIVSGYHGDAAITVPVGEISAARQELIRVTEEALWAGLQAARVGGRLSDLSHAIEQSLRGHDHGYGIVRQYGGHGIGTEMHQEPHLLNYGEPGKGPKLLAGMALAVEPMVTLGGADTDERPDGWTVIARDGSAAAHAEHTVALTDAGPWVLTAVDGGASRLAALARDTPAWS